MSSTIIITARVAVRHNYLLLLLAILLSIIGNYVVDAKQPFGIQSGMNNEDNGVEDRGNSYGGSMIYDESNNIVVLTGSTYGYFWDVYYSTHEKISNHSNCFVSILELPGQRTSPYWRYSWIIGKDESTSNSNSACSAAILLYDDLNNDENEEENKKRLFLGGSTEEGGLLTSLRKAGSNRAVQYGIVLDMTVELERATDIYIPGGRLFHSTTVQSVRAIASDGNNDNLYVVSEVSESITLNPDTTNMPNLLNNDKYYGKTDDTFIRLEQLPRKRRSGSSMSNGSSYVETLDRHTWSKEIGADGEMRVAALDLLPSTNTLVLVHSSVGEKFSDSFFNKDDYGWDGFVTLIDADNGGTLHTLRMESQRDRHEIVHGYCRQPGQEKVIFVVGSTTGQLQNTTVSDDVVGRKTAFLARASVNDSLTLTLDWYVQITAAEEGEMVGLRCAVTNDGKHVYVGGDIYDGAVLHYHKDYVTSSFLQGNNGNDVWIGQLSTVKYKDRYADWNWLVQLGSDDGDEHLADMSVDSNNNLLIYGHTDGSFLRRNKKSNATDVFVMSLLYKTGQFVDNMDTTANNNNHHSKPSNISNTNNKQPPTTSGNTTSIINNNIKQIKSPSDMIARDILTMMFTFLLIIVAVLGLVFWHQRNNATNHREKIEEYTTDLDVDVNIQPSGAGGFHCTYIDPPAYDKNDAIANDALFSLDESNHQQQERDGLLHDVAIDPSSYSGLVNAYESTWDDLSHHQLPPKNRLQ